MSYIQKDRLAVYGQVNDTQYVLDRDHIGILEYNRRKGLCVPSADNESFDGRFGLGLGNLLGPSAHVPATPTYNLTHVKSYLAESSSGITIGVASRDKSGQARDLYGRFDQSSVFKKFANCVLVEFQMIPGENDVRIKFVHSFDLLRRGMVFKQFEDDFEQIADMWRFTPPDLNNLALGTDLLYFTTNGKQLIWKLRKRALKKINGIEMMETNPSLWSF